MVAKKLLTPAAFLLLLVAAHAALDRARRAAVSSLRAPCPAAALKGADAASGARAVGPRVASDASADKNVKASRLNISMI